MRNFQMIDFFCQKSLEDAKEVLPKPIAASTAPQSKSDTKATTSGEGEEKEQIDADSTNDNELPSQSDQADVEMAEKAEPEKMDVDEAPEEVMKNFIVTFFFFLTSFFKHRF